MPTKKPDDDVGQAGVVDSGRQTQAQKAILGSGGEDGGCAEPKSTDEWAARGAAGGEPGRAPVAIGGNSQGQGDRMPAAPGGEPATNPKTRPGERHDA